MNPETQQPVGPEALGFDPPTPLYLVNEDNVAITEPLLDLHHNMRVAIANPWTDEENYAIGVIKQMAGEFVLEFGSSIGKLVLLEDEGWACLGLARMTALAQALADELAPIMPDAQQSFTTKLIKRAGKGKKRK